VAARAATLKVGAAINPAVPSSKVEKAEDYHGTAAVELGSAEAGFAIARFRNQGAGDDRPATDTAANTKAVAVEARKQSKSLESILAATGSNLSAYTF
jgi:hypothetical protein